MITVNIYGAEVTYPARYNSLAHIDDGRLDDFWSDDWRAVLARFKAQIAEGAKAVIAFDFLAGADLGLFFRDEGLAYDEIRQASDEALDRMIEEHLASGG